MSGKLNSCRDTGSRYIKVVTSFNLMIQRCLFSDVAFSFAKATLQYKSEESNVIIGASETFAFAKTDSNTHTLSVELLMKLQRSTFNFATILACAIKIKEVQSISDSSHHDSAASKNYTSVQIIKRNREPLLSLYRDFWKEMLNDPISISTLMKISKKVNDLVEESQAIFNQLLRHKTKSTLQLYASFVELIYFDKELANTLYQEANSIEDHRTPKPIFQSVKYAKPNKIIPSESQEQVSIHEDDGASHIFEECPSETARPELKKDFLFRNGLKTPRSNSLLRTLFIIYVLLGVGLISGSIVMSGYQFTFIKSSIMELRTICTPQLVPVSVIRNLRSFQNWVS